MHTNLVDEWAVETSAGAAEPFHFRAFPEAEVVGPIAHSSECDNVPPIAPTPPQPGRPLQPAIDLPFRPTVWIHQVERPAIVLGSRQDESVLDAAKARTCGYEVSRRRSGGGLVLIQPAVSCWIDVLLPKGHRLWVDDISVAFHWVGDLWAQTLADLGIATPVVHRGGIENREHGKFICFAGLGPGEVLVEGRKVVGLSQRRTREGARFQGLLVSNWDSAPLQAFIDPATLPSDLRLDQVRAGHPHLTAEVVAALPRQFVQNLTTLS